MILVTGATGRVGNHVVRTLRQIGQPARALVRKGSEYYWLNDTGCAFHFGDLRDPRSLGRACKGVRHIVACSGVAWERTDNHHTNVTVDGHRALFEAARAAGVERVVLLSCMGAARGYPIPAFVARRAAEELLIHSGLEYAILRSCVTEHVFLDLAWRALDRRRAWLPGPGQNTLSPIAARDLGRLAVAALDLDGVRNRTVDVGGDQAMTAHDAYQRAAAAVGDQAVAKPLPSPLVAIGRRIGRPFRRYSHRLAELNTWFSDDFVVDPALRDACFGVPLEGLDHGLKHTAAWQHVLRDPEARQANMVHPQFYATIYAPGVAALADLPDGPPPPAA